MIRWFTMGGVLWLLTAASPPLLYGQFNPYGDRVNAFAPSADPRLRRAQRERAVAAIGPIARDFVETHGDEAVAAIFACPKPVGEKLAEWHNSGGLGKLPRPRDLLRAIAQPRHGGDVALWAIQHGSELTDTDCFDAYLLSPLEFALGLKQLATGAAEARARRLNQAAITPPPAAFPEPARLLSDERVVIAGVCGVLFVGLWLYRRRKKAPVY